MSSYGKTNLLTEGEEIERVPDPSRNRELHHLDDAHFAALEDNPETAEKPSLSTLLSVFVNSPLRAKLDNELTPVSSLVCLLLVPLQLAISLRFLSSFRSALTSEILRTLPGWQEDMLLHHLCPSRLLES